MASLSSGVLLRLLRDMESSSSSSNGFPAVDQYSNGSGNGSVVLQVTGIVPALGGSDLFPDRGFYLQVSDLSHSTYVSLPPGHDDLILSDNLQIGQLIHASCLEPSSPVPVLHGLRLIPGRHPFSHEISPISTPKLPATGSRLFRPTISASPQLLPERKKPLPRSESISKLEGKKFGYANLNGRSSPMSLTKRKEGDRGSSLINQPNRISVKHIDEDGHESDESSVITSTSSTTFTPHSFLSTLPRQKSMRKIWDPNEKAKDERCDAKPILRMRRATFTQGDFTCYGSNKRKDDSLEELWIGKRDGDVGLKVLLNNSNKRKLSTASKSTKNPSTSTSLGTYDDMMWPESNVLWGSLTLNLAKHGKEALRQRDLALQTALNTLQEACALERLIQCLSTYSELQVSKENDPKRVVDKFLDFHQELASAILEYQALARSSFIFPQLVSVSASNTKKDESEKRKRAVSWIIASLQSELSNTPRKTNIFSNSMGSPSADRKFQNSPSRQRKVTDTLPNKGTCNLTATDLAKALHSECNRWFLRYIEKFLDSVRSNNSYTANDSQVASLLCLLKRVDDWLVTVGSKERTLLMNSSKDSFVIEEDDAEAYGRVRRKIYEILLRHVESAAMALESMSTIDEDSVVAR